MYLLVRHCMARHGVAGGGGGGGDDFWDVGTSAPTSLTIRFWCSWAREFKIGKEAPRTWVRCNRQVLCSSSWKAPISFTTMYFIQCTLQLVCTVPHSTWQMGIRSGPRRGGGRTTGAPFSPLRPFIGLPVLSLPIYVFFHNVQAKFARGVSRIGHLRRPSAGRHSSKHATLSPPPPLFPARAGAVKPGTYVPHT